MRTDMEWYVYVQNFNSKRIEKYNIFNHYGFMEDVRKTYKKHKDDYNAFCEDVKVSLMYYFWNKCEWEIILSGWPEYDGLEEEKIDVYQQVMMNKDIFMKYVWDMAHARKRPNRENNSNKTE